MAKRKLNLNAPVDRGNGLNQTQVELDYAYFHEDTITVYTKQGNVINVPINPQRQNLINNLEDAAKASIEGTPV